MQYTDSLINPMYVGIPNAAIPIGGRSEQAGGDIGRRDVAASCTRAVDVLGSVKS